MCHAGVGGLGSRGRQTTLGTLGSQSPTGHHPPAPSSREPLEEDGHGWGPACGQEPLRAGPPCSTPSLCVSISKRRFSRSVTKPVPPGPMRVEVIGKRATLLGTTPCPLYPCPPRGPLQPGALGQLGAPIPEAVWCQQHARFVLYVARRELTVVSGCSRCPGESLGRVRPRMGGRWGGGQRKRESPEVSWERRPEDRLTARPGSAQARLLQRGLWRLLAEPERGAGDAGRRGRRNRCVRRGNSLENRLCSRCR